MLTVMLFHAGLPIPSGGVAGVTLFFVLSGYLIASLLMTERELTGTVNVPRFLAKRAWRLLPALIAVMVAVLVLGIASGDFRVVAEDSLLTLAYVANWARSAGDPMGLWNHAWSLAIEEQFYVFAPVALLTVTRFRWSGSWTLIAVLAMAAIGVGLWRALLLVNGASGERIYFGTDTRIDALLLGCLLAAIRIRAPDRTPSPWVGPISLVTFGVLAVLPLIDLLGPGSGYSLIAFASFGVVVASLRDDQAWTRLADRPLVWLGERSYSLYLVHVPVFMYLNVALASVDPALQISTAVLLSLALAEALFRYVERPLRYGPGWRRSASAGRGRPGRMPAALRVGPEIPA